jgi:tripartite-type tricarboxylate transporter receptor subunit TctC
MAPPKTPRPIVDKLNATVNEILRSPEAKASLDRLNVLLRPSTPEQFAAFAQQQIPIWGEMVRASGATAH